MKSLKKPSSPVCRVICTKWENIFTVNLHSLPFWAKKYGPGWMGGWIGGKAGLRIAYSNQKFATWICFQKKLLQSVHIITNFKKGFKFCFEVCLFKHEYSLSSKPL